MLERDMASVELTPEELEELLRDLPRILSELTDGTGWEKML